MGLSVVRDLREVRAAAGPEEIERFETDVFAGFVLARARNCRRCCRDPHGSVRLARGYRPGTNWRNHVPSGRSHET